MVLHRELALLPATARHGHIQEVIATQQMREYRDGLRGWWERCVWRLYVVLELEEPRRVDLDTFKGLVGELVERLGPGAYAAVTYQQSPSGAFHAHLLVGSHAWHGTYRDPFVLAMAKKWWRRRWQQICKRHWRDVRANAWVDRFRPHEGRQGGVSYNVREVHQHPDRWDLIGATPRRVKNRKRGRRQNRR